MPRERYSLRGLPLTFRKALERQLNGDGVVILKTNGHDIEFIHAGPGQADDKARRDKYGS